MVRIYYNLSESRFGKGTISPARGHFVLSGWAKLQVVAMVVPRPGHGVDDRLRSELYFSWASVNPYSKPEGHGSYEKSLEGDILQSL